MFLNELEEIIDTMGPEEFDTVKDVRGASAVLCCPAGRVPSPFT